MKVVMDASAVLSLLLQTAAAGKVAGRLREAEGNVHAPHLLDVEVAQILRHHAAAEPSQADRCRQVLRDLREMPIIRHPHSDFLDRCWELRNEMTTSDAAYVALAEFLDAPLLTLNDRLGTQGHNARIELLTKL
jgi:predicted nucleic acid-binding protein